MSSKNLVVETAIRMSIIAVILTLGFVLLPSMQVYSQMASNQSNTTTGNSNASSMQANASAPPTSEKGSAQPSVTEVSAPGVKANEYYVFTQELKADEEKLGVPVAVFTLTNIIVHKGDTVTIHFYNTAEEKTDRHTFSMQSPYKMDHDLAGGENATFSFKADTVGGFTYYCRYDLPSMIGHLEVLP
jgi:plastocyanin